MTIEHRLIPDGQIHETKGASTAIIGQANVANGDGTSSFKYVDYTTLLNKPSLRGYVQVLTASSAASSQQPVATNTALQVEFGSAQSTADVNISSTGVITFNTAGQYLITRGLRFARTALTGVANIFTRHLINGSQSGPSTCVTMDNNLDAVPVFTTILVDATVGQTMTTEIERDGSGVNVGGLFAAVPSASGWNSAPSASLIVHKYKGVN